mgnify:CR=1 FL=1
MILKVVYTVIYILPSIAMLFYRDGWQPFALLLPILPICVIDFSWKHCTNYVIVNKVQISCSNLSRENVLYSSISDFYNRLSNVLQINKYTLLTTNLSSFDRFMFKLLFKHVIVSWCQKQFKGEIKISFSALYNQLVYKVEKVEIGEVCLNSF